MRTLFPFRGAAVGSALVIALLTIVPALAQASLVQISSDPSTNPTSQHATQVEPDTFAFGSTIVSTFQSGRFFNGGASNIGFATSTDRGQTWTNGFLPGSTVFATPAGKYDRASDPSVAFDAKHNVWMISWLGLITPNPANESTFRVDVLVSRSTDGGLTWGTPVAVAAPGNQFYDKNWTACDDTPTSRFYGRCYTEFDNNSRNDLVLMSTSTDGGLTWGPPTPTADQPNAFGIPPGSVGAHGIGGQPLVQPNGRVVVPYVGFDQELNNQLGNPTFTISSFVSVDGGASWSASALVSQADFRAPNGGIRATLPLPSAELDRAGKVYVTWGDCRFEPQCAVDDLVLSTSTDGIFWSAVRRIPLDRVGSGVDHFLPGLAVDRNSAGGSAHLALVYYFYPDGACTAPTCQLDVGFTSSRNGGANWSTHQTLAGPMSLSWLAQTSQGPMVGDYFSTSIPPGSNVAVPVFMVATAPSGGVFDEATFAVREDIAGGSARSAEVAVTAEPAVASKHLTPAEAAQAPHKPLPSTIKKTP
jgi:BNR repeat-like domain